ncbi:LysM peptidoglycan-binding domain-containing protein [Actinomycetospora sp. TBRC 11914]|uniref:LysM peptidoglycan-binding domain-containing protein n=1 Tax=Actinomycetospora sp. TBRC 11914 TaxID=2729387 RepID=UPI00145D2D5B|nr:LysM peptidoglycan-binding domain-containing protein [Actinomycetospora sp. TBRC 11914]NMO90387.1 LysM peptidoglycan-binding domain-containing protein [Actinomycetospora sp. TBRC 11914]
MQTYTVRSGDLIDSIARRFGTTREVLLELNPTLSGPYALHVGQTLRVDPSSVVPAVVEFTVGVDPTGQVTRRSEYRVAARREERGLYTALFPVEVSSWTWQATVVGDGDRVPAPGVITLAPAPEDPTALRVSIVDLSGAPADRAFHLRVSPR